MTKKPSLKDAFVRSLDTQEAIQPAIQAHSDTAIPPAATPPAVQPAPQQTISPAIQVATYTANPLPVPPAIQRTVPKKKATFNLDASLHQRLKVAAAVHSREMVDIVEDALLAYLPGLDHSKPGLNR